MVADDCFEIVLVAESSLWLWNETMNFCRQAAN